MNNEYILLLHIISSFIFLGFFFWLGQYALISFITLQGIIANIFVLKQIRLFGMNATTADAYIVGSMIGVQLLQEYYGKKIAQKTIGYAFLLLVFYTIASQYTLVYAPHAYDQADLHFQAIFYRMPRIGVASIGVYIFSLFFDSLLYQLVQKILQKKYLIVRNIICTSISQFVDTFLFSFLGLWGLMHNIWQVIIISYIIKMVVILMSIPFLVVIKNYIAKQRS